MRVHILTAAIVSVLLTGLGCAPERHSATGFRLPLGDAERGRVAFLQTTYETSTPR